MGDVTNLLNILERILIDSVLAVAERTRRLTLSLSRPMNKIIRTSYKVEVIINK